MDALKKHIEQQYELNAAVQQQKALADGIAGTLGQGLTNTFDLLIQGSQNWQQSLQQIASGVLVDIANQLLRIFVIEQAINSIRSFLTPFNPATPFGAGGGSVGRYGTFGPNYGIPQRAMGGSVMAGQGYLVGEKGPELFMPGRSGGIAPAGTFGGLGNIVVNVDAGGSNVQGDGAQANALGKAIGIAVQQELIKQKRPGGLLA
jgi:phage-related minor tail protein